MMLVTVLNGGRPLGLNKTLVLTWYFFGRFPGLPGGSLRADCVISKGEPLRFSMVIVLTGSGEEVCMRRPILSHLLTMTGLCMSSVGVYVWTLRLHRCEEGSVYEMGEFSVGLGSLSVWSLVEVSERGSL